MPATAIVIIWLVAARPEAENTDSEARLPGALGPAVFTVVGTPPSMDTRAMPETLHLTPIQLTAVPVEVNMAVDAITLESTMVTPLQQPVIVQYHVEPP